MFHLVKSSRLYGSSTRAFPAFVTVLFSGVSDSLRWRARAMSGKARAASEHEQELLAPDGAPAPTPASASSSLQSPRGAAPPPLNAVAVTKATKIDLSGSVHTPRRKRRAPIDAAEGDDDDVLDGYDGDAAAGDDARRGSTVGQAIEGVRSVLSDFTSLSFSQAYMTRDAKALTLMVLVACLLVWALSLAVLLRMYLVPRTFYVDNLDSMCYGLPFTEIKTNTVGYHIANLIVGCLFALWFVIRSVRLEKGALLVCYIVVAVTVISRALYFAWSVAGKALSQDDAQRLVVGCQACFTLASVLLTLAVPQCYRVNAGYGWRTFAKGVAKATDVELLKRYKQLDACAKLDLYVTVNAFISLFFFVADNAVRVYGFCVVSLTVLFLLLLTNIVRHRRYCLLYLFYFVCLLMPAFYISTLALVIREEESTCRREAQICARPGTNGSLARIVMPEAGQAYPPPWQGDVCNTSAWDPMRMAPDPWHPAIRPCIFFRDCYVDNVSQALTGIPNATEFNMTACVALANATVAACCNEYGRCEMKRKFFETDKPLVIALAAVGTVMRLITMIVGYRQAQAMDVPSVQDMFKRGERNMKSFALLGGGRTGGGSGATGGDKAGGTAIPSTASSSTAETEGA